MFGGIVGVLRYGSAIDTSGFVAGLARMGSLGAGAGARIAAALGGIGATLGAGFGAINVVKTAADMETGIVGLAKASDLAGADLEKMKGGLYGLSTSMAGIKVDDLLAIATAGAKLGVESKDLLEYSAGIAKVSSAIDDMPAGEIADQIGKLNLVFGLGVQGTLQFGSAIDKIADAGASSAAGILNVSQRISGVAKISNLSAQETVALSGALLDTGTQSELAAGALTDLIVSLTNVKAQANFAEVIGVSAEQFAATVKDKPIVAIEQFLGALGKLDAAGQQKALEAVDIKGLSHPNEIKKFAQVAETLAAHVARANSEFLTLNQINDSYNKSAATTNALWVQASNRIQLLKNSIGSALLPIVNAGLGRIGTLVGWLEMGFAQVGSAVAATVGFIRGVPAMIDGIFGAGASGMIAGFAATVAAVAAAVGAAMVVVPLLTAGFVALGPPLLAALGFFTSAPVVIGLAAAAVAYFAGYLPSLGDLIAGAGFAVRNFGLLAELSFLKVGSFVAGFIDNLALIPANFLAVASWIGTNWVELMLTPLSIVGEGVKSVASAFWAFLQNPTGGFALDLSGMFAEVEAFKRTLATAPAMAVAAGPDISARTAAIDKQIADKEAAYRAGQAEAPGGPKAADAGAFALKPNDYDPFNPAGAKGTFGGDVTPKFAGAAALASTDAYKTISGALAGKTGGGDEAIKTGRDTLKESRKHSRLLKTIADKIEPSPFELASL